MPRPRNVPESRSQALVGVRWAIALVFAIVFALLVREMLERTADTAVPPPERSHHEPHRQQPKASATPASPVHGDVLIGAFDTSTPSPEREAQIPP